MLKKSVPILLAVVATACAAGAVWTLVRPVERATSSGPVENITIGNIGEYSIFNIIARENGSYAAEGLDAEVHEFPSGPPAVAGLLAGQVDVAVAADFVGVRNMFSEPHLRILAQVSRQQVFDMIARRDKGIVIPEDLKGKRIGVTKGGAGEFFLGRFLTLHDLSAADVTVLDMTPQQMADGIASGTIDAAVVFEPYVYQLRQSLGQNALDWPVDGDSKTYALLYTTDTFIKGHPEAVRRYLRALLDAERFVAQDDAGARRLLVRALGRDQTYMDQLWPKFDFRIGLDQSLLTALEDQAGWTIDHHLTTASQVPDYLDRIDFTFLDELKSDAVNITH